MPLVSIPEALLSPLLLLGEPHLGLEGRCLGFLAYTLLWTAWLASQRGFVPSIGELSAVTIFLTRPMMACCVVVRCSILSWPAFLLLASLQFFHDESKRAQGAQLALCALVVVACIVSEWRGTRVGRYVVSPSRHASGASVLFRHALSGIASWADPRVPFMHATMVVVLILTCTVLSRLDSSNGVVATSLIGSLVALLQLRALLDLATQRIKGECPMLIACPRYRVVGNYQTCIAVAALYTVSIVIVVAYHDRMDRFGAVAMTVAATFVTLQFLSLVACRVAKLPRNIESGVLCVFGLIGIVVECV